jgi:flavin reductase (DIM6/NTAB) family NADH-FMN oxidoreductase RutF
MSLWSPIGLADSQSLIDVRLGDAKSEIDVTGNQVVLSLAPLQIGIGDVTPGQLHEGRAEMRFYDRATGAELGSLRLVEDGALTAAGPRVTCFRVTRGSHACLPMPMRLWQSWLQRRRGSTNTSFHMRHDAVAQLAVFYICPRPVVLVSVDDGTSSNLFPMDLIGPVGGESFVLALRNSSASVATLQITRRAALADVPLAERALAYSLGKHHRKPGIDWSDLPCPTTRSCLFGLRVPEPALRVRECEVLSAEQRGSHTVFVCRVASDEVRAGAPRLFHTSGIHGAWRRRRGAVPWHEPAP